jgi:16S rRNA (cytosine1402-N4)-methyltransferase
VTAAPHISVLRDAIVASLMPKSGGHYVDGTFGAGGYSEALLGAADCKVWGIDRDPDALAFGAALTARFPGRLTMIEGNFGDMDRLLGDRGVQVIDGVALDLGVSSMQLDRAERGFSFRADGPLDMRMDPSRGDSAAQWLASASEAELKGVIANYGEERFAQQIARAIVASRAHEPITRTRQLAAIVAKALGSRARGDRSQDPATRTFQAVRIHVNQELQELSLALDAVLPFLASGARLATISFHSLEDRLVKQFLRRHSTPFGGDARLSRLAIASSALPQPPLMLVGRAIRAGDAEVAANPRARSATLRVAERTGAALQ